MRKMLILTMVLLLGTMQVSAAPIDDIINWLKDQGLPASWYAPTNKMVVDKTGVHFYSGNTGMPVTWTLTNQNGAVVGSVTSPNYGTYTIPLPSVSGYYYLSCTGSGCDNGDWIVIDLNKIAQQPDPRQAMISGICALGGGSTSCTDTSESFPYFSTTANKPTNFNCASCVPRDVTNVEGISQAIIIPPPTGTMPPSTPEPTQTTTTGTLEDLLNTGTGTPGHTPSGSTGCNAGEIAYDNKCVKVVPLLGFEIAFAVAGILVAFVMSRRK